MLKGIFYCAEDTLDRLEGEGQVLFRYCDADGKVDADANPNGSLNDIAGICNAGRNVFGMMPHPERAADDLLGNIDGKLMLAGLLA